PTYVDKLIDAFTPGPLTFILKDKGLCAKGVTAGLATIAVRIPDHPVARELIEYTNRPVAAPSANISGRPSPTTAQFVEEDLTGRVSKTEQPGTREINEYTNRPVGAPSANISSRPSPTTAQFVEEDLTGRIYGIVDGGQTGIGLESTILDCTTDTPTILRPGGITGDMIREATGLSVFNQQPISKNSNEHPKAPGMKYRHYAPSVPLIIKKGNLEEAIRAEQLSGKRV